MAKRSSTPRSDLNRLAARNVGQTTDESGESANGDALPSVDLRSQTHALGHQGGVNGGRARADGLTPERRSEIAREAARVRWSSRDN
jgi:hypothetical protein